MEERSSDEKVNAPEVKEKTRSKSNYDVLRNESANGKLAIFTVGEIGETVNMLIDTGSAVTLVHIKRVWEKLSARYGELREAPLVVAANGQPLEIAGEIDLNIVVAGVEALHRVLIADDIQHDCLLGWTSCVNTNLRFNLVAMIK